MTALYKIHHHDPEWRHPRAETMPPLGTGPRPPLEINRELDAAAAAGHFAEHRRIRLPGLLGAGAVELYDHLQQADDWVHLVTGPDGVLEHDLPARHQLGRARVDAIGLEAQERARHAFQYRYEAMRVASAEEAGDSDPLDLFARLMAGADMKRLLGTIIGAEVGGFADGQATAYGPGDFLTLHDDAVEGKHRLAAFVYGLTPGWRLDWGGLLLFHGDREREAEALAPRFNTLDLFAVPRAHSVSLVSHAAAHRRYAITGWLTS